MSSEVGLILVVDDNEMNRDMLSRRLQRQGYSVVMAEDGIQALEVAQSTQFDLILLDIMMPRMNGYEVLEHLKKDPALRDIPVIMISAVDDLDSVVKCIELGADDYLFKPFNPILLKARVGACLEKKRLHDQEKLLLQGSVANGITPASLHEYAQPDVTRRFDSVAILAVELITSDNISPQVQLDSINDFTQEYTRLSTGYGIDIITQAGHHVLFASGLNAKTHEAIHLVNVADMALVLRQWVEQRSNKHLTIRCGVEVGTVNGGVMRTRSGFVYTLWGEVVNHAMQLMVSGTPGTVVVGQQGYGYLDKSFLFAADKGLHSLKSKK